MNKEPKTIEVCFSPALINFFDCTDSIVVVIDVLRATSSICVAFAHGAECIIPLATIEESLAYQKKGYLAAGERNGEMIKGFDMGNSPFSFMEERIKGSKIAITTTNGTQAIKSISNANKIVIGSFLNLNPLCNWLSDQHQNVVLLCSGFKNKFNLEDTLCAGAIVHKLKPSNRLTIDCDSALASEYLYLKAKDDLYEFLKNSSHRKRLKRLHIESDIKYCLTPNQCNVVPILKDGVLYNFKEAID